MRITYVALPSFVLALSMAMADVSVAQVRTGNRTAGAEIIADGASAWAVFEDSSAAGQSGGGQASGGGHVVPVSGGGGAGAVGTPAAPVAQPQVCSLRPLQTSTGVARVVRACLTTGSLAQPSRVGAGGAGGGGAAAAAADPRTLAERAAAVLELPAPAVHMSPAGDQIVRLPVWLWIDADQWAPRRASAAAGPVTSTVTATPARVTWDMGNGDQVECDGPGTPYQERYAGRPEVTDCRYTYRLSSAGQPGEAYEVTATVHWELTWSASGAAGGGSLGSVPMSTSRPVRVTQIHALVQ